MNLLITQSQKNRVRNTESEIFTTNNNITNNTISKKTISKEEEEEVTKNNFVHAELEVDPFIAKDISSFISMFRLNFTGIDFNVEGNFYFVNNSGFVVSSFANKKIAVGLAKDIFKKLFEKWDIAKPYFYQERAKKILTKVS